MSRLLVLVLVGLLGWWGTALAVESALHVEPGTPVLFGDGIEPTFTLSGLVAGTGQYSDLYDKGTADQPGFWDIRCWLTLTGTNTPNELIEVYLGTSDGTNGDGNLGATTAALPSNKRLNLELLFVLVVDQTTTNTKMVASKRDVSIPTRYFFLAVWNATSLNFQTSPTAHRCQATPVTPELQ